MCPDVSIFGITITSYGLLSAIGLLFSGIVLLLLSKRRNTDIFDLLQTAIIGGLGVLFGAHVLFALTRVGEISETIANFGNYDSFWAFMKVILRYFSGMVFYGGLYGGLLAGVLFARHKKYPLKDMSDVFACSIPAFHMFGRIGCFFAGCCYGIPFERGIAGRVISSGGKENIHRLPIQLIEAVCLLILFIVLVTLFVKSKFCGRLMSIYLLSYSVLRFILEFFRGDEIRGRFLIFSTSQWISLITVISVSTYLLLKKNKNKHTI